VQEIGDHAAQSQLELELIIFTVRLFQERSQDGFLKSLSRIFDVGSDSAFEQAPVAGVLLVALNTTVEK
jgi:hypothetical protein